MMLDEYISKLEAIRAQHGGTLPVQKWMPAKGRHDAPAPALGYERVYPAARGTEAPSPQFFNEEHDNPVQKGDPVVRI